MIHVVAYTTKHHIIARPLESISSPTKYNTELETKPAKDINEITADYKNPQGLVKSNYFKPLESTYVANRPLEPLVCVFISNFRCCTWSVVPSDFFLGEKFSHSRISPLVGT